MLLIILLCTLADALLVAVLLFRPHVLPVPTPAAAELPIETASTFINFDLLYGDGASSATFPKHDPISVLSHAQTQVSAAEPARVFPPANETWMTLLGPTLRSDRRLWVEKDISTIVQYRVLDYGMESCSLALALPPHASQQLLVGDMRDGAARVDVWALASSTKLDTNKLSWQNKPTREVYLGSLTASYNTTDQLEPFPCRSASYQTFELVCPASGCAVDITSIGEVAIGLYMRQFQTM